MRCFFRWLCAGCLLSTSLLLPARAQDRPAPPVKYWIFLKDKAGPAGKVGVPEAGYVSARTQARRALRGRVPPSTLDAPLSSIYLEGLEQAGVVLRTRSRWINAVSAYLSPDQVQNLRRLPFVAAIQPVGRAEAAPPPDPPEEGPRSSSKSTLLDYGSSYTQLALINAVGPLERGINGAGVRLGFLDTEYGAFQHPVFARLVSEGRLLADSNFVRTAQTNRHGLTVASVAVGYAAGELIGPAYGAEVLAATTEYAPTETNQEEDDFVAGLEWLEANGVDVVNVSLGYTTFDAGQHSYTYADLDGQTAVTTLAVNTASSLGVVVVTSAGNEGCDSPDHCWYYIGTPSDAELAVAVGGVQSDSLRYRSSSYGPTADGRTKPDVAAMAVNVRIAHAGGGYTFGTGTSFASPLVAGVACQMLQVNPELTPVDVRDILRATASQHSRPDNALGWGIVNAEAAVRLAEALRAAGPPPEEMAVQQYPNPFSTHTQFDILAPSGSGAARLSVYNVLGQRVAVPFEGYLAPGLHRVPFEAGHLPPGVYLYVFEGKTRYASGTFVKVQAE